MTQAYAPLRVSSLVLSIGSGYLWMSAAATSIGNDGKWIPGPTLKGRRYGGSLGRATGMHGLLAEKPLAMKLGLSGSALVSHSLSVPGRPATWMTRSVPSRAMA